MTVLYTFITIVYLMHFIFNKYKITIFDISIFGLIVYSLPLYYGQIYFAQEYYDISIDTYIVVIAYFIILNISNVLYKMIFRPINADTSIFSPRDLLQIRRLCILSMILASVLLIMAGSKAVHAIGSVSTKSVINSYMNFAWMTWFNQMCIIGVASALFLKSKRFLAFFMLLLIIELLIFQSRAGIFFIFVMILFYLINTNSRVSNQKIKFYFLFSGLLVFFVLVAYKSIKGHLILGNFGYISDFLTSDLFLSKVFNNSESNTNMHILNLVITEHYKVNGEYILDTLSRIIPMSQKLLGITYQKWSVTMMDVLLPPLKGHKTGYASSMLGEIYSMGGMLAFILFSVFYSAVTFIQNIFFFNNRNLIFRYFALFFVSYCTIYINRISIGSALSFFSALIVVFLILYYTAKIRLRIKKHHFS